MAGGGCGCNGYSGRVSSVLILSRRDMLNSRFWPMRIQARVSPPAIDLRLSVSNVFTSRIRCSCHKVALLKIASLENKLPPELPFHYPSGVLQGDLMFRLDIFRVGSCEKFFCVRVTILPYAL